MQPIHTPGQPRELQPHEARRTGRGGFTLTELLVVIAIIAVLASLTTVGVLRALDTAKQTRMKTELDSLDLAMKAYKEKYGSYPPCDLRSTNATAIKAHVARAFPRYANISTVMTDLAAVADANGSNFRPDQALVFWLGGFNPDITQPFLNLNTLTKAQRTPAFFDFDQSRLATVPSIPAPTVSGLSYFPAGMKADATGAPYIYWDPGSITTTTTAPITTNSTYGSIVVSSTTVTPNTFNSAGTLFTNAGTATPYWSDTTNPGTTDATENWANIDSFQLIASGMDGKYGVAGTTTTTRLYPTGTGYDLSTALADDDNVTNFCAKARLGDAKP